MNKGYAQRRRDLAIRCAKLRREGLTLGEVATVTGVDRTKVANRIQLGERLIAARRGEEES